jgi:Rrf2 family transcriptional regulator, nitric oxide-sensitive transcriptional repressor
VQLTRYTDYSLRVLLYLALTGREATIAEIAERYGISENHLVKVVHHLGTLGYIETRRGRHGGIRLAREPGKVSVGEVVRAVEPNFTLVECFDIVNGTCPIAGVCGLEDLLWQAHDAFMQHLDKFTLAECLTKPRALKARLDIANP